MQVAQGNILGGSAYVVAYMNKNDEMLQRLNNIAPENIAVGASKYGVIDLVKKYVPEWTLYAPTCAMVASKCGHANIVDYLITLDMSKYQWNELMRNVCSGEYNALLIRLLRIKPVLHYYHYTNTPYQWDEHTPFQRLCRWGNTEMIDYVFQHVSRYGLILIDIQRGFYEAIVNNQVRVINQLWNLDRSYAKYVKEAGLNRGWIHDPTIHCLLIKGLSIDDREREEHVKKTYHLNLPQ
jgi:hypothetical protein